MKKYLIILSVFLSLSFAHAEGYRVAHQRGQVDITRQGKPVKGEVLSGDKVRVHKRSLVILKNSKETLKILQDTIITPYEKDEESIIDLAKGALVALVVKKNLKVTTKSTSMGVRGTQFFVQVTGKDDVWMCVQEGVVNVATKGVEKSVDVPAGKGVFVGPKKISDPKAYAWTKKINWKMNPKQGDLHHNIKLNYDLLNNFYD